MKKRLQKNTLLLCTMTLLLSCMILFMPMHSNAASNADESKTQTFMQKKTKTKKGAYLGAPYNSYHKNTWKWNEVLETGKKYDLMYNSKYMWQMSNKRRKKLVKWTSSNPNIVSVNKYGIATVKKAGVVKITCKAKTDINQWKSKKRTIRVIDTKDITFSVTESLNESIADSNWENFEDNLNRYKDYAQERDNANLVNTVTLNIINHSSKNITINNNVIARNVAGYSYNENNLPSRYSYFQFISNTAYPILCWNGNKIVSAHTSSTQTFEATNCIFIRDNTTVYRFRFTLDGRKYSMEYKAISGEYSIKEI